MNGCAAGGNPEVCRYCAKPGGLNTAGHEECPTEPVASGGDSYCDAHWEELKECSGDYSTCNFNFRAKGSPGGGCCQNAANTNPDCVQYQPGGASPSAIKMYQPGGASPSAIKMYQWNPHYECFDGSTSPDCSSSALEQITSHLTSDVDFANIIELEKNDDFTVSGFQRVSYRCDTSATSDQISFFYNSARWKPETEVTQGCAPSTTRAYQVFSFSYMEDPSFKVVVAGAHFDHAGPGQIPTVSTTAVADAIAKQAQSSNADKFIFLGDTNVYINNPTMDIQTALLAGSASLSSDVCVSTPLDDARTCCYNQGGSFPYPFDRIFANFGSSMEYTIHDDPVPSWATFAKFHRAIGGVLTV
jgi:hypothetical protein